MEKVFESIAELIIMVENTSHVSRRKAKRIVFNAIEKEVLDVLSGMENKSQEL